MNTINDNFASDDQKILFLRYKILYNNTVLRSFFLWFAINESVFADIAIELKVL